LNTNTITNLNFKPTYFYPLQKLLLVIFAFVLVQKYSYANETDSLKNLLASEKTDTGKVNLHLKIAAILLESDTLKAFAEFKTAIRYANATKNKVYILRVYERVGRRYLRTPYFKSGLKLLHEGLHLAKKWKNEEGQKTIFLRIADLMQNQGFSKQSLPYFDSALLHTRNSPNKSKAEILMQKGRAYYDIGEYKPAMQLYVKSQKIFEDNKIYDRSYGHLLHFIGSVFKRQEAYDKAVEYYEKELALAKQLNDTHLIAEALYLCGGMYGTLGNLDKELEYNLKALEIFKTEKDYRGTALMLGNISSNYNDRKDYQTAIQYCKEALPYYLKSGDQEKTAWVYRALGDYYSRTNRHSEAIASMKKALEANAKTETKQLLTAADIQQSLAFAYQRIGDYKNAFTSYLNFQQLKDSIHNQENREFLHDMEAKYETDKKEQQIVLLSKDKKMQDAELALKDIESRQHKSQRTYLIIGSIMVLIVAGVAGWAFFNKRKDNKILAKQFDEINYKNIVIKEKNKDITDSINYAKRIQEAVLPIPEELNGFFSESFVFYRPKDIVSGDFYWFTQFDDCAILAVGDCTGHGVPGAFMSIIGHDLLNQVVLEDKVRKPADILRILDKRVTSTLNKRSGGKEYQDGMDIAICKFDKIKKQIVFAGANRPLVVKRGSKIIELPPNKFAVGGVQDSTCKLFFQHELSLEKDDTIFMFSDGFHDQFGGASGKKLKYHQLKEYISNIKHQSLNEHQVAFATMFDTWKGDIEQLDDVCLIGIRI
jgi:serine phosphatase RsbU (regulator of sigma subunit)